MTMKQKVKEYVKLYACICERFFIINITARLNKLFRITCQPNRRFQFGCNSVFSKIEVQKTTVIYEDTF